MSVIVKSSQTFASSSTGFVATKTCFKTLTVLQIMSLQVGEGEVMTGTRLPLSILMPRYFTCPNTSNNIFSLDFQLREGSNTITSTMNPLPSHLSP